jgi:transposase
VYDVTSQKNRIDKFLQSSGFRLSAFISDIFGASGRNIMRHLAEHGGIDREGLDKCLKTKTRHKINEILVAVNGTLSNHQCGFLKMMLAYLEEIETHKRLVESAIEEEVMKHSGAMVLLCTIPGISTVAASAIIAEIGTDMSAFPDSQHISSWAGICPGNNESAGKRKSSHINKGNAYLKSMLCEVAWVVAGKRNTYLASWYWRVKQQKGAKRATVALARKILVVIYSMLKNGTVYDESSYEIRKQQCEQKRTNRMIHELAKLGYTVTPV